MVRNMWETRQNHAENQDGIFFSSAVAFVEKKVQENECEEDKDGDEETANNKFSKEEKDL